MSLLSSFKRPLKEDLFFPHASRKRPEALDSKPFRGRKQMQLVEEVNFSVNCGNVADLARKHAFIMASSSGCKDQGKHKRTTSTSSNDTFHDERDATFDKVPGGSDVDSLDGTESVETVMTAVLQALDCSRSPHRRGTTLSLDSERTLDETGSVTSDESESHWLFSQDVLETYLAAFVDAYSTLCPALVGTSERYLVINMARDGSIFFSTQDAPAPCIAPCAIQRPGKVKQTKVDPRWFSGPMLPPEITIPRPPGVEIGYNPTIDTDLELTWCKKMRGIDVQEVEAPKEVVWETTVTWHEERGRSPSVDSIPSRHSSISPPPKRRRRDRKTVPVDTIEILGLRDSEPYTLPIGPSSNKILQLLKHVNNRLHHTDISNRRPGRPSKAERIDSAQRAEAIRVTNLIISNPISGSSTSRCRYTLRDGTEFRLPGNELFQSNARLSELVEEGCKLVGIECPRQWLEKSHSLIAQGPPVDALPLERYTVTKQRKRKEASIC